MPLPRIALLPTLIRELVTRRQFRREPEPDIIMDDPEAVRAYAEAGRIDGPMAAYYLFHSARVSQVFAECRAVLDLGCGPATQLAQIAALNPQVQFRGVDLSPEMLGEAKVHVDKLGLANVSFVQNDITTLAAVADASVDGVMSTMALHHLPTRDHLRRLFRTIARVLKPGGAVYITDFGALKSLQSVLSFAYLNEDRQPYLFSRDYERSLRAAFRREDFEEFAAESLPDARVYATFKMPILVVVKTADRAIPEGRRASLRDLADRLPARYRRDLDEVRMFFRLGGLGDDPFLPGPMDGPLRRMADFFGTSPLSGIPTSRFARAARVARAGLRWGLQGEKAAAAVAQDLGALKGPWMKFGQMASYINPALAPGSRGPFAELQDRSAALDPKVVRSIVERELGKPIAELFLDWQDTPLAAASVAQLHWARLRTGEAVVVKVKYPGIDRIVRGDLRTLKLLAPLWTRRMPVSNAGEVLEEVGRMVLGEGDFRTEADHQEKFRRIFEGDPDIFAPRVHREYCSREVLTMDYVEGQRFAEFRDAASQPVKDRAARAISRAVITSFHKHCFFNADPHPGNYLFLDGKVCFIDFGFSKTWTPDFVRQSKRQSLAGLANDVPAYAAASRALGYELKGQGLEPYRALLDALRAGTYKTWLEDKPFHFTPAFVREEVRGLNEVYRRFGPVRLSPDHLPLHRVFWGHHFLFAELNAEINLHRILVPMLHEQPLG